MIKRTMYYLRIWWISFRKSLKRAGVYKTEMLARVFRALIIVGVYVVFVESLFTQTDSIVGWSRPEYYLLLGLYNLVNYIGWAVFSVNIWRLEQRILRGQFDLDLVRPSGAVFNTAFKEFFIDDLVPGISGIILISVYFISTGNVPSVIGVLLTVIGLLLGLTVWFGLHLLVSAGSFIWVQIGANSILGSVNKMASVPTDVWGRFSFVLYTVFPLFVVANVPARLLLDLDGWELLVKALLITVVFTSVCLWIWKLALRRYNGGG